MHSIKFLICVVIASVFALTGCGGDSGSSASDGGSDDGGSDMAAAAVMGSASIAGTIQFVGEAPERQELNLDRDCMEQREEAALSQSVVVNDNGTLRWVFVHVKEGLGDVEFAPNPEPVVLDQEGCTYQPHVFGIQTGQTLKILNSDPFLHNINAQPDANRPFNLGMPMAGMEREETFRVPEVMVPVKCDVHPWMSAFAGVTTHPFFSTSDASGAWSIENLPAGDYVIEAWHEEYGTQARNVSVGEGESVALDFTFGDGEDEA